MTPPPDPVLGLLSRLFAAGLRLYPESARREYAEEMRAVFDLKAADAARRGSLALARLAFREACDLPLAAISACMRVPGSFMNRYFPATVDQVPWIPALLSLVPLLMAGPGRIIAFYASGFGGAREAARNAGFFFPYLTAVILVVLVGLIIGAARKFPRWSYPYPLTLVFALTDLYNTASYHFGLATIGQNICFPLLALMAAALCLPPARRFYRTIRQDWTLLSYGLFAAVLFILSQFDTDEYPALSPGVLLPSLIALVAALAHLRVRPAPLRILALEVGAWVGVFFWIIGIFTGAISIFIGIALGLFLLMLYGAILTMIVLSPLLVLGVVHHNKVIS